ncbi:MAG: phosphate ABC transporter ATP-binding protein [Candidatus Hodarchaeales archaeon]|jgi:ABC-type phosphate transport system ATPase subunit
MNPIIKLIDVTIHSGTTNGPSVPLVHNVNLNIFRNKIIGIVGPSGAGKTTLLKAIALLNNELIDGKYFYHDEQILPSKNGMNVKNTRSNMIFIHQFPVLFKGTVQYNIEYGLRIRKEKTDPEYLNELIDSFKLRDLLNRNVHSLSGGEKQRVCLLRAMAVKPEVLILDEPTQNLDPANIKNIEKNIKQFRDQQGGTVIIVTHNLFQAQRITDKTVILVNGQIIETGNTENLFSSPKKQKTSDFISGKIIF